jgi:hypothetical protein
LPAIRGSGNLIPLASGSSSAVERQLPKLDVAGSIPVSRSKVLSFILRGNFMSEPTYEELKARLSELEKQGSRRTGSLEFRVSEKGGVSVYGLGRFPVTLYYEQWTRLLEASDKLREFLEENKSKLKLKGQ